MRKSLLELIENTIIYQYDLPENGRGILQTIFSTDNDKCYLAQKTNDLAEIIYNSVIEYSFNEFELHEGDYATLYERALQTKLKYNPLATDTAKQSYGFLGEVLLYSILYVHFRAKPLIARGYFYNPLEKAETKGYDSYQLIENDGKTELWFGEVKFYVDYKPAVKKVLDNIEKALSDQYLHDNIISLSNHKNNFNIKGTQIETILKAWEKNPKIKIAEEVEKYDMKFVYPVLILYEQDSAGFDKSVQNVVDHISEKYDPKTFDLSIDFSVFFILLPLEKVKEIKTSVIQWIESRKQLMS